MLQSVSYNGLNFYIEHRKILETGVDSVKSLDFTSKTKVRRLGVQRIVSKCFAHYKILTNYNECPV